MFPLIQNKSYPPLLLLGHLSNEAIKKTDKQFFLHNCREATYEKNFMDNISNFLHVLPNCTIYLTQAIPKNTHLLQALKLDMQFFSRCCNWFGSWGFPLLYSHYILQVTLSARLHVPEMAQDIICVHSLSYRK